MARFPKATWRGPIPNKTPSSMQRPILGLILHVEQGSEHGTDVWFHNSQAQASAHFGNPQTGPLDQWVDTNDKAWAEVAGNSRWISVEHEGYANRAPTPTSSQIENDAQLLAWLHKTEGVPLQITDDPNKPGLGWHGMGGAAWGGHTGCPGDRIKNTRPQIIARAKQIVAPPKPSLPTFTYRRLLRRGMVGTDVVQLKRRLRALGYHPRWMGVGPRFSRGLEVAVREFQLNHHLVVDGIVGPITAKAINR